MASLVYEPISPSIIPGLNPLFAKNVWIPSTLSSFAPELSLTLHVFPDSQPV